MTEWFNLKAKNAFAGTVCDSEWREGKTHTHTINYKIENALFLFSIVLYKNQSWNKGCHIHPGMKEMRCSTLEMSFWDSGSSFYRP